MFNAILAILLALRPLSHEPPGYGEMEYVFVGIEPLSGFKSQQLPIFRVHLKAGGVTTTYLVGAPMSDVLVASMRSMYGKVRIEEASQCVMEEQISRYYPIFPLRPK